MPPPFGSGAEVQLTYIAEVTHGVTPATPTMQILRLNGFDINAKKGELVSQEVRADRQTASKRHGLRSVEGTLPGELMLANHDDMLEAAMSGTWDATVAETTDIGVTATHQVVRAAGSFLTDGFRPGDIVTLGALVVGGDNGDYRVAVVTALAMTLVNLNGTAMGLTTEAASAMSTCVLKGSRVDIGTLLRTFSMERAFTKINQYQVLRGCAINTMDVTIQPGEIPGISCGVLGMDFDDWAGSTAASVTTAAPTNEAMSPFDGRMYEGGASIGILTGLNFQLNNNRELGEVVGATSSPDVFEGDAKVTGTVTMLFENATHLSKFINETETKLWGRLRDPADSTAFINFVMNRVKYFGADINPPRTGEAIITLPFEALRDSVSGVLMSIQRSNA